MSPPRVRRLESIGAREMAGLCDVLIDCVEGGASVNFMWPMTRAKAETYWRGVAGGLARGERALVVAEDERGEILGTAQAVWAPQENQPHRADISKMLVRRSARRDGVGALVLAAAEKPAARCWCSTPRAPRRSGSTSAAAGNGSAPCRDLH
jgi:GNAT superfamily N-acetyltransferase